MSPARGDLLAGGYILLPLIAWQLGSRSVWLAVTALLLPLGLAAWLGNLRRLRAVTDTPTSRIASAAQGYVELVGVGRPLPDTVLQSPAHRLPCLWYRYRHYRRRGDTWRHVESGESDARFLLDDGTGTCLLDPAGAEIIPVRRESFQRGDDRIEQELLLAGDRLYVLGDFGSPRAADGFDAGAELDGLLTDWKADPEALRRRFDLDGDGGLDAGEWDLARRAAIREVERRRQALGAEPASHALFPPGHGRPYLIAAQSPHSLAGRYRWRARLHGLATLAALTGLSLALRPF